LEDLKKFCRSNAQQQDGPKRFRGKAGGPQDTGVPICSAPEDVHDEGGFNLEHELEALILEELGIDRVERDMKTEADPDFDDLASEATDHDHDDREDWVRLPTTIRSMTSQKPHSTSQAN